MLQRLDHDHAIEIAELQLLPSAQGRGIGTRVMRRVMADAGARGVPVRLRVGRMNRGARALYERLGFRVVEETETHVRMEWSGD